MARQNQHAPGETGGQWRPAVAGGWPAETGNRHCPDGMDELHRREFHDGNGGATTRPKGSGALPRTECWFGLFHAWLKLTVM